MKIKFLAAKLQLKAKIYLFQILFYHLVKPCTYFLNINAHDRMPPSIAHPCPNPSLNPTALLIIRAANSNSKELDLFAELELELET